MNREEILNYMRVSTYKPLTAEDLVSTLNIENVGEFLKLLNELEREGEIILTRKNRYGITEKMGLFVGRIDGHAKGFGFLVPERSPDFHKGGDIFISAKDLNGAMHNDRVIVRLISHMDMKGKPEGEVIRILTRENELCVGTVEKSPNFAFVVPDDKRIGQDIFIPFEKMKDARDRDKVVVRITRWPEARRNPEGEIIEILGKKNEPGIDILCIVRKHKLPEEFPQEVIAEAQRVSQLPISEEAPNRLDLRDYPMITMDGADAKDLDDAVSLEILDNGSYYLGVHIADVGFYVKEGSALDKEALERGTSVYLVDRVIPMLPPELSNNICSLNPRVDRLSMTVFMEINKNGHVKSYDIKPSIININHRMTYDKVNEILDGDREAAAQYQEFVDTFLAMKKLSEILKEKRTKRGSIDFDFPESKVILDRDGKADKIIKLERGISEKIIEEFMIVANETVAQHMYWLEVPFLYRVHEEPTEEKMLTLNEFLHAFGYHIRTGLDKMSPKSFQEIVEKVKGRPEEKAVNTVILRSMKHASYSDEPLGHFGLASEFYSHFTSPIRRYPDLVIHRIIRETLLEGPLDEKRTKKLAKFIHKAAAQSSMRERVAEEAERESVDLKKVEFMLRHLGEEFTGIISSVTNFGFFVELDNSVEGLVHVSTLTDDYYYFDDKHLVLIGKHTGETFRIGDSVKVLVAKVNVEERNIDFELIK
ncbi:ribonuclease R [Desulfitibacter alkalitolerans]|uniref:ribonuclease R n=1 Tax=Desulfitibacter alkalitolerans TaxID=264641 RepID=UPI000489B02E|nr:ribonuclease R [Desulfitibacter alkalitolerans]